MRSAGRQSTPYSPAPTASLSPLVVGMSPIVWNKNPSPPAQTHMHAHTCCSRSLPWPRHHTPTINRQPTAVRIMPRHDSWSHTYCHLGSTWRKRGRGRGWCCLIPFGVEWVSFPGAEHWRLCVVREQLLGQSTCLSPWGCHRSPYTHYYWIFRYSSVFVACRTALILYLSFPRFSYLSSFLHFIFRYVSFFSFHILVIWFVG